MPTLAPLVRYGLAAMLGLLLIVGCATSTSEPTALDREALVALYNATDGANWSSNSNWLSNAPIGEWHGVTTDANDRVTELFLEQNQLNGEIPLELGNLINLQWLRLSGNQLSGCIPEGLQYVPENDLSGLGLPFCAPIDRGALVALYNASGGPRWAYNDNWLSDAPIGEWRGVFTDRSGRVTELYLDNNELSGEIPPELGSLANLAYLDLSGNQLSRRIPSELGDLTKLMSLALHDNLLSGEIPSELGSLINLTWLGLYDNQLRGKMPSELGSLTRLEELYLYNNQLSGRIPPEFWRLTNLEVLWLSGNQFTGCIPGALRDVPENDFFDIGLSFCGG